MLPTKHQKGSVKHLGSFKGREALMNEARVFSQAGKPFTLCGS